MVVIAKLPFRELDQIVGKGAPSTSWPEALASLWEAAKIGVHFALNRDADLVMVAAPAHDLRANAAVLHRRHDDHFPFVPYGDWFVGLRLTPISEACDSTAPSVRPSLRPMTRVGVFSRAKRRRA